jgi:hypothetical protein
MIQATIAIGQRDEKGTTSIESLLKQLEKK